MLTTLASYRFISANIERSLSNVAAQPMVERETEYYLANIENVKTIDDFLSDDRLFNYAMKAWGLEDMNYAKAFMRKVLTEGIDEDRAFANTLSDSRYKEFAEAFNFNRYGATTTIFDRTRQGTVDLYLRQTVETNAGEENEGVRLALYFERNADKIEKPLDILADKALLQVVKTALSLPDQLSLLDLDRQVEIISEKIDIEDFQDPEKLDKFLTRFAAIWEIDNPTNTQLAPNLLIGQPLEAGFSVDLLTSLQSLKLGGL